MGHFLRKIFLTIDLLLSCIFKWHVYEHQEFLKLFNEMTNCHHVEKVIHQFISVYSGFEIVPFHALKLYHSLISSLSFG